MIRFKFIHRSYHTPWRLHQMKFRDNPYCDFCSDNIIGTFIHMIWQCPEVCRFRENISSILSNFFKRPIPQSQCLRLLDDTSSLKLTITEKRLLLAGLTAAKRTIACRGKPPVHCQWEKGSLPVEIAYRNVHSPTSPCQNTKYLMLDKVTTKNMWFTLVTCYWLSVWPMLWCMCRVLCVLIHIFYVLSRLFLWISS